MHAFSLRKSRSELFQVNSFITISAQKESVLTARYWQYN